MPPPIVPAPTTAARAIGRVGVSLGHVRNLAGLTLGEEQVAHRLRLGRQDAVGEQLDFTSRARVEIHGDARLDGVNRREWRAGATRGLGERRANGLAGGHAGGAIGDSVLEIAGAPALPRRGTRSGESNGAVQQIAVDHGVEMPACWARVAVTGLPPVHISSASAAPHNRGSRWVPPAPGMIPRCTSGWPTLAVATATR